MDIFNIFRKGKKENESSGEPSKIVPVNDSAIYYFIDEEGICHIYFSEKSADKKYGVYTYDHKALLGKYKRDTTILNSKYKLYERLKVNKDEIKEDEPILIMRKDKNEFAQDIRNQVCLLPPILSPISGVPMYLKEEWSDVFDNEEICTIYPLGYFNDENTISSNVYSLYFDRLIIQKSLCESRGRDSSGTIKFKEWIKQNGDYVNEGDELYVLTKEDSFEVFFTYTVKSKFSGILEIIYNPNHFNPPKQNELLCTYYKNEDIFFKHRFYNRPIIKTDDFTKKKTIKWEVVGGLVFPFGTSSYNPIGGVISSLNQKSLIFTFQNINGKDYIAFGYFSNEYKLNPGDIISFLFENNIVLTFKIQEKPYKSSYGWKNLMETKVMLTEEEIITFSKYDLMKFKIDLISSTEQIVGDVGNSYYYGDICRKVVKGLASEYRELVLSNVEDYTPLIERNQVAEVPSEKKEKCYLYLMIDRTNNFYKIGISSIPVLREKTLQSEKPTIELICHKAFPSRIIAESFEKALHNAYSEKRIRGEWFSLSEQDVTEIKETLS